MKKAFLILLAVVLALSMVALACPGQEEEEEEEEVIEISVGVGVGEASGAYEALMHMEGLVEQRAPGRVEFVNYPGGTLLGHMDSWEGVLAGVADIAMVPATYIAGQFPLTGILDCIPGPRTAVEASTTNWLLYNEYLKDEWKDVKVIYINSTEGNGVVSNKPIRTPDDFGGLRIRTTGPSVELFENLGATIMDFSVSELYEAFQKNMVDGAKIGAMGLDSLKLAEVVSYNQELFLDATAVFVVMNLDKYNSLPSDIKQIFDELGDEMGVVVGEILDAGAEEGIAALIAEGGENISFSEEERMAFFIEGGLEEINASYAAGLDAKGLAGTELLEAKYEILGIAW